MLRLVIGILILSVILFYLSPLYYTYKTKEFTEKIIEFKENIKKIDSPVDSFFQDTPKYYINLEKSVDRKKSIKKQEKELELNNIERIDAIHGKDEIKDVRKGKVRNYVYENNTKNNINKSELACVLSHLNAMEKGYKEGHPYFIIMEDDLFIHTAKVFPEALSSIWERRPENLDLLALTNTIAEKDKRGEIKFIKRRDKKFHGTQCYIITRKGVEKVLNHIYKDDKLFFNKGEVSKLTSDEYFFGLLNSYTLSKRLFLLDQCSHSTTIEENDSRHYGVRRTTWFICKSLNKGI